jgi:hypothetical protein
LACTIGRTRPLRPFSAASFIYDIQIVIRMDHCSPVTLMINSIGLHAPIKI